VSRPDLHRTDSKQSDAGQGSPNKLESKQNQISPPRSDLFAPLYLTGWLYLRHLFCMRNYAVQLPILAYHSVLLDASTQFPHGWDPLETILYSRLCAQLDMFRAEDWQSLPATGLGDPIALSSCKRKILFTFDDGHESDLLAAEALAERAFAAIFFIPCSNIGRPHFVSRDNIKRLCLNGFAVGSHGLTHTPLTHLSADLLWKELVESKARLEDLVGQPVQDLAVPFGRYNRRVVERAKDAGYTAILTSKIDLASPGPGSCIFPRVPVKPRMTDSLVYALVKGSLLAKLRCRLQGNVRRATRVLPRQR